MYFLEVESERGEKSIIIDVELSMKGVVDIPEPVVPLVTRAIWACNGKASLIRKPTASLEKASYFSRFFGQN